MFNHSFKEENQHVLQNKTSTMSKNVKTPEERSFAIITISVKWMGHKMIYWHGSSWENNVLLCSSNFAKTFIKHKHTGALCSKHQNSLASIYLVTHATHLLKCSLRRLHITDTTRSFQGSHAIYIMIWHTKTTGMTYSSCLLSSMMTQCGGTNREHRDIIMDP